MRVAIPLSDDGISKVFDTATRLLVVDLKGNNCFECAEVPTFVRPPCSRAKELHSFGVDVLLCEGISHALAARIREQGIDIESPVSMDVDDAIFHILRHRPQRASRHAFAA